MDNPRSNPNVLRRMKPPLSGNAKTTRTGSSRTDDSSSSQHKHHGFLDPAFGFHLDREPTSSLAEIQIAEVVEEKKSSQPPPIYPELDRCCNIRRPSDSSNNRIKIPFRLATCDFPPPTPASPPFSGIPSTRFSESPRQRTHSHNTTPASIASQSPGLVAPLRTQNKNQLQGLILGRPPVTRSPAGSFPNAVDANTVDSHGLVAIKESLTASNSTARESTTQNLPSPPPSPLPRESMGYLSKKILLPILRRKVSRPALTFLSSERSAQSSASPRAGPPSRPSRDGTPDMQSEFFKIIPVIHSDLSTQSLPTTKRRGCEPTATAALSPPKPQCTHGSRTASTSQLSTSDELQVKLAAKGTAESKIGKSFEPLRMTCDPNSSVVTSSSLSFSFLSRKHANGTQAKKSEKERKGLHKGPIAGICHEGYRGIGAAKAIHELSPSKRSFSAHSVDPEVISRDPIIKDGNTSSEISQRISYQSLLAPEDQPRDTLWTSPNLTFGDRRPAEINDFEGSPMKSTLAFQRSSHRLRSSPYDPLHSTQLIATSGYISSRTTSFDSSVILAESHFEPQWGNSHEVKSSHPAGQQTLIPKPVLQPTSTSTTAGRRCRLPQVGRIPKVVSSRTEYVLSSKQLASESFPVFDPKSIAKGPSPSRSSAPVPDLTTNGSTGGSIYNSSSRDSSSLALSRVEKGILAFSARKDKKRTIGTTSSSCSDILAFSGSTVAMPQPYDPPAEDDMWDQCGDLCDEPSPTSSRGTPFHLETYESKLASEEKPLESPNTIFDKDGSRQSKATTISSTCSADMTERLRAAFQPHPSPSTPSLASEYVWGYENRNTGNEVPIAGKASRKNRRSDASSASEDESPFAQVNLRVDSMKASKWLTFGHVLFSDVRHELAPDEGSLKGHSILVIDGLGNDDWSFYAAETYPAATFFNLSPRAPLPEELKGSYSSFPLSPPNHHQIQYVSHLNEFPFAPQSFTAIVYRFPVAAPEAYYRSILTEARRVLKPGGFIELSILDIDLNNMGTQGRRTVRRLKESINEKTPDTSLGSTADLIVRLLGKVGFTTIKAARVGVPVASSVTRSDSKADKGKATAEKKKDPPSLSEMMSDNSPLADEGITKMVSRVGRWWYTRCYESAAENPSGKSIWSDKSLLSEAEELGTSLKLMVCCARAPLERCTSRDH